MDSNILSLPTAYLNKQITLTFFKKHNFRTFLSQNMIVLKCVYKNIYVGFVT